MNGGDDHQENDHEAHRFFLPVRNIEQHAPLAQVFLRHFRPVNALYGRDDYWANVEFSDAIETYVEREFRHVEVPQVRVFVHEEVLEPEVMAQENEPVVQENEPVVQENEPVVQENEPVVQENEPVVQENEPVVQENEPVVQENEPVVQENEPVVQENEPVAQENEPVVQENEPVVQENEPVVQENEPVAQENEPVASENEPVAQENEPVVQENVQPAVEEPHDLLRPRCQAMMQNRQICRRRVEYYKCLNHILPSERSTLNKWERRWGYIKNRFGFVYLRLPCLEPSCVNHAAFFHCEYHLNPAQRNQVRFVREENVNPQR